MVPISPVLSPPPPPPKLPVALVGLSVLVGLEVDLVSLLVSIALDVVVEGGTFEVELNPPTLEEEDVDLERHQLARCTSNSEQEKLRSYTIRMPMAQEPGIPATMRTASDLVTMDVTYTVVGCAVIGAWVAARYPRLVQ
jgi:hypothetical protein